MSNRTDQAIGRVKQTVGELTHNKHMKRRGRFEGAMGKARHLFGHMRRSVRHMH